MTFRYIPLGKLVLSPENMRKTGDIDVSDLVASFRAHGIKQNLNVVPELNRIGRRTGRYEVNAGGRRWRALQVRLKAGEIGRDFPVPCIIGERENALEVSVAENSARVPPHPADQFTAFKSMVDGGKSVEEVAASFGVLPSVVQRRLKLANISPRLFELFRSGGISLDQIAALTLTDDHAAQEAAWFETGPEWQRSPQHLRQRLTSGEVNAATDPRARFVGLDAYREAGGVVRADLFAEEGAGYLNDPALLDRLVAEKLASAAAELEAEGWGWTLSTPSFDYSEAQSYARIYPGVTEPTDEDRAAFEALGAEFQQLEADGSGETPEGADRMDEIEAEIAALQEKGQQTYPADQKPLAGAVVTLTHAGQLRIERGLVKREDVKKLRVVQGETVGGGSAPLPRQPGEKRADGLSAALLENLTAHRTLALRAAVMQRPDVALIAAVQALLHVTHYGQSYERRTAVTLSGGDYTTDPMRHGDDLKTSRAKQEIDRQRGRMQLWLPAYKDLWAFLSERTQEDLLELLAYAVGQTIHAVQSPNDPEGSDRLRSAADMARAVDLDMADWWEATGPSYFGRVKKPQMLQALSEGVSPACAENLAKLKRGELADQAETRLHGKRWLPAVLRRPSPVQAAPAVAAFEEEDHEADAEQLASPELDTAEADAPELDTPELDGEELDGFDAEEFEEA